MNLKVEHGIIAVLVLALLYYVISHQSLLNDLSVVPHEGNPHLKAVAKKHGSWFADLGSGLATFVGEGTKYHH